MPGLRNQSSQQRYRKDGNGCDGFHRHQLYLNRLPDELPDELPE